MINMLKNWPGSVTINGVDYASINAYLAGNTVPAGDIHIVLHPVEATGVNTPLKSATSVPEEPVTEKEIRITVKKYMTEPSNPGFDFMAKWNNDNPMPMRIMQGTVVKETRGMVYMKLHGLAQATITCSCCGKELTNPISRHYGIGPICLKKIGILREIDDIENIKEELVNMTWEGWVIKSAITDREEVTV